MVFTPSKVSLRCPASNDKKSEATCFFKCLHFEDEGQQGKFQANLDSQQFKLEEITH